MVRGSCTGGPSTKPNVDLYVSVKKESMVDIMFLNGLVGVRSWIVWVGEIAGWPLTLACRASVKIAVCVTLSGIMVFLTGVLSTICAASAIDPSAGFTSSPE